MWRRARRRGRAGGAEVGVILIQGLRRYSSAKRAVARARAVGAAGCPGVVCRRFRAGGVCGPVGVGKWSGGVWGLSVWAFPGRGWFWKVE